MLQPKPLLFQFTFLLINACLFWKEIYSNHAYNVFFQLDRKFNEFRLISIMSEHTKTINCVKFHPTNSDLIATTGADKKVIVWNIATQHVVAKLDVVTRDPPKAVGWTSVKGSDAVCFIQGSGPLYVWAYSTEQKLQTIKEASGFSSSVCQFRWHPKNPNRVALGHLDGSISICNIGMLWFSYGTFSYKKFAYFCSVRKIFSYT